MGTIKRNKYYDEFYVSLNYTCFSKNSCIIDECSFAGMARRIYTIQIFPRSDQYYLSYIDLNVFTIMKSELKQIYTFIPSDGTLLFLLF